MQTALLKNSEKYGFSGVMCGLVEPSTTFAENKRQFIIGDGRHVDVNTADLVAVDIPTQDLPRLFPLCF